MITSIKAEVLATVLIQCKRGTTWTIISGSQQRLWGYSQTVSRSHVHWQTPGGPQAPPPFTPGLDMWSFCRTTNEQLVHHQKRQSYIKKWFCDSFDLTTNWWFLQTKCSFTKSWFYDKKSQFVNLVILWQKVWIWGQLVILQNLRFYLNICFLWQSGDFVKSQ